MIRTGNAAADTTDTRGWLLGHFRPGGDARHSDDLEVKWAVHPRGEERAEWVENETRSALVLLVSGRFRIEFPGREVVLAAQGDYVVFHQTGHSWHAEEDSVVVVIRWPSVPGYTASQGRLA